MNFETRNKTKLNYSTWGNMKSQTVILFFHGFPGAHVQARSMENFVLKNNFGLIAVDRPGYGKSTFTKPGDYKSHLDDILELFEVLGIQKFSIVGVSGGAPISHLMANYIPDRIQQLCIVCGLVPFRADTEKYFSPFQRRGFKIRKYAPYFIAKSLAEFGMSKFGPEEKIARFSTFLHPNDVAAMGQSPNKEVILETMEQARAQNANGILWDSKLYISPWMNDCAEENFKKFPVYYHHGKQDRILPHAMTEYMQTVFPFAKFKFYETDGHYSLPFNRADEILQALKA